MMWVLLGLGAWVATSIGIAWAWSRFQRRAKAADFFQDIEIHTR